MTYLEFHLVFLAPPILLLAMTAKHTISKLPRKAARYLALLALIALAYTTPWDNYLVWRGVWSYGAERVVGAIGYVPIEEYAFFVLQPILTGLWFYRMAVRWPPTEWSGGDRWRWLGASAFAGVTVIGAVLLTIERGTYLGLILVWAGPVLALMWAYAGRSILAMRRAFVAGVAVPTLYLWVADATAIGAGIWTISERYTLGVGAPWLPLEEAIFFLVTNLLVVQGLILFLWPPGKTAWRPVGRGVAGAR